MPAAELPANEPARLAALASLEILGTAPSPEFDVFAQLAGQCFSTPMAALSLVDARRQWFKAAVGLSTRETPRESSFCAHAILNPGAVLYVPDASKDRRFADNPLVTGEVGVRFYAGAPIMGPQGHAIGALCVLDRKARVVSADQLTQLRTMAAGVSNVLKMRETAQSLQRQQSQQLMTQAMLASVFQKIDAAVAIVRSTGGFLLANSAFRKLLGYSADELANVTVAQLTRPEDHATVTAAHARQLATGEPYEMDIETITKDGTAVPVHITSHMVQRGDKQCFRVVTLRPMAVPPQKPAPQPKSEAVIGSIQFLGLEPVKAACGPRWEAMRSKLLLAAEGILKRRLSAEDAYSRTDQDGFSVWFKHGNEDENASRLATIGREIRIMLLGELGEDANSSVISYTQVTEAPDASKPPSVIMQTMTRRLAERRHEAEKQAQELLETVMRDQPRECSPVLDNSGQTVQGSFVDLPRSLRGRFAGAMSLAGGPDADIEAELFRLGLAASTIMDDIAEGKDGTHFISLPAIVFIQRKRREQFLSHWRGFPPSVGSRLTIMISDVSSDISPMRLAEAARLLQPLVKGSGVMLNDIEKLPFDPMSCSFSLVGLCSESVASVPDGKLRAFIAKVRQARLKVLTRLGAGEPPRRWQSLGVDFTTAA